MGLIQDSDVGKVLADEEFMEQVVSGLVEDKGTMDSLAEDLAGNVQDALENDADLRHRLIRAAMSNEEFKRKVVEKIVQELDDD